jgi:hypothetical protein
MADGGGPTEQDRSEGTLSLSEGPNERGKSPLVTLGLFSKVTRRKGGTITRHHPKNGYTPNQEARPAIRPHCRIAALREPWFFQGKGSG